MFALNYNTNVSPRSLRTFVEAMLKKIKRKSISIVFTSSMYIIYIYIYREREIYTYTLNTYMYSTLRIVYIYYRIVCTY